MPSRTGNMQQLLLGRGGCRCWRFLRSLRRKGRRKMARRPRICARWSRSGREQIRRQSTRSWSRSRCRGRWRRCCWPSGGRLWCCRKPWLRWHIGLRRKLLARPRRIVASRWSGHCRRVRHIERRSTIRASTNLACLGRIAFQDVPLRALNLIAHGFQPTGKRSLKIEGQRPAATTVLAPL